MTEALETFWATLAPALAGLLGTLLSLALYRAQQALAAMRDSQVATYASGVLKRLDEAARDAVGDAALSQELSRRLADGRLTRQETAELIEIARSRAEEYLGPKGLRELERIVDVDGVQLLIAGKVRAWIERRLGVESPLVIVGAPEKDDPETLQ